MLLCARFASMEEVKDGDIVAARVARHGTTLKRFYRQKKRILLKPSNAKYQPIEVEASAGRSTRNFSRNLAFDRPKYMTRKQ